MSRTRVALLACTNVIGGHEFQAAALGRSLMAHVELTVFVNREAHAAVFRDVGLDVRVAEGLLLGPGSLPHQCVAGWRRRAQIRALVDGFDHVIVSAGAVEAGVAAGVAVKGYKPVSMYLPFFYDRVPVWGWKGHLYNCILSRACRLFDRIVTINRIQARVIHAFADVRTTVVRNQVRHVDAPSASTAPARLVFIGRLDHQKRIGELIDWLDFEGNPYQELCIVGDGPLRTELEAQAGACRHLRCTFHGWVSPAAQDALLHAHDVLVLNSLLEGEPLAIREAQLRGMRVIARDIVGVRGVTRPFQRYADAAGLRSLLLETAPPTADEADTPSETLRRRDTEIARLATALAGGCS